MLQAAYAAATDSHKFIDSNAEVVWNQTELYFGTGKPDGSVVSDAEFQQFVRSKSDAPVPGRAHASRRLRSIQELGRCNQQREVVGADPLLPATNEGCEQTNSRNSRDLQDHVPTGIGLAGRQQYVYFFLSGC